MYKPTALKGYIVSVALLAAFFLFSFQTYASTPAKSLQTFVLPLSGHDVNLHYNAGAWFGVATGWAYSQVIY
jgi:hypothetical protein